MYNNFLLIPNPTKPESVDFVSVAARHIADCGKKATVPMKYKNLVGDAPSVVFAADDDLAGVDIAVVLGGDGTVLRNIDYIRRLGVPLFGVNFGHLGYLTQCEPELAIECLDRVMRGDFEIEERIMLNCRIVSGGKVREFTGLNEVVLHRAAFAGALHVTVHINGNFIERFAADGVLVSTPTGSTAYNMSAGGPVIIPTASNLVITPICAHAMADCSIVASGDDIICIKLADLRGGESACLSVDNIDNCAFGADSELTVTKSCCSLRLINFNDNSFYQTLKHKLYSYKGD